MLYGEHHHQIDQKGRIRIPAKIKAALGENFIVTKGTAGCLFLFSQPELGNLHEKLKNVPLSDNEAQRPLRLIFSSASELDEDNQGRFLLPKNLREWASIQKDLVVIGVGTRAEIWAKEEYERYLKGADFDAAIGELGKYGV